MSALDNLDNNLSGEGGGGFSSLGGYVNQVYLGEKPAKQVRMKRSGKTVTVPAGARTISVQEAKALYLKDPKVEAQWLQTLRKNGVSTADPIKNRALWDIAVAGASDWYATSGGTQKITPEQYANWYLGGQKKKAPALPSRSVYQYAPEQLDAKADEITRDVGGFAVTDEVKAQQWYKDLTKALNEMVMQGTVTTTKQVKNPKTGKMENVTIQKPEVTTEAIAEKIKTAVIAADPASVERKKNLDIEKWFLSQGGNR